VKHFRSSLGQMVAIKWKLASWSNKNPLRCGVEKISQTPFARLVLILRPCWRSDEKLRSDQV